MVQRQEVSCPIKFPLKFLLQRATQNPQSEPCTLFLFCFVFFRLPLLCLRLLFLGDPNIEVVERGQVLKIKSARLGDQARYQCSVTNSAGKQSRDFNLSVYGLYSVTTQGGFVTLFFPN